ncbi:hypothetical protein Q1695_003293 [Nippostrongylus brasiliensis]|nr:hypothetical protein Q1695_003293 [Nippostrongylus brasiliensis]
MMRLQLVLLSLVAGHVVLGVQTTSVIISDPKGTNEVERSTSTKCSTLSNEILTSQGAEKTAVDYGTSTLKSVVETMTGIDENGTLTRETTEGRATKEIEEVSTSPMTSTTLVETCVDQINPRTGRSECGLNKSLCHKAGFVEFMEANCPQTCGYCKLPSTNTIFVYPLRARKGEGQRSVEHVVATDVAGMSSFCNGIRHLVKAVLVEMFGFAQQEERSSTSFRHDFEYEPQRKRARSPSPEEWTDDQRLTLINEVMNIPQLWDVRDPSYKYRHMGTHWPRVVNNVNLLHSSWFSVEPAKQQWKNLRDGFVRKHRERKQVPTGSSSVAVPPKWRFHESMLFHRKLN